VFIADKEIETMMVNQESESNHNFGDLRRPSPRRPKSTQLALCRAIVSKPLRL